MSKEYASFAAAGKFLTKFMLVSKSPHFCPFLYLNSTSSPFHFENLPPFGFPLPKFFFRSPLLKFSNFGFPLLKGGNTL